jgi:hypothetical protein
MTGLAALVFGDIHISRFSRQDPIGKLRDHLGDSTTSFLRRRFEQPHETHRLVTTDFWQDVGIIQH